MLRRFELKNVDIICDSRVIGKMKIRFTIVVEGIAVLVVDARSSLAASKIGTFFSKKAFNSIEWHRHGQLMESLYM
jgi:hypothetical protein